MTYSDKASFLAEVEPLTHHQRTRAVVELGRSAASGDARAQGIIAALGASDSSYERLLGLLSAFGSRHGAAVRAHVNDPSRTVRRKAARMLAVLGSDDDLLEGLGEIVERCNLYRALGAAARRGRYVQVEAFLESRLAKGRDVAMIDLLPLTRQQALVARWTDFVEAGGPAAWARMAERHPAFTAQWFQREVARSSTLDPRLRQRVYAALGALSRRAPDAALALVEALFRKGDEPIQVASAIGLLVRSRPAATFDLLKARHESARPTSPPGAFGVVKFDKVASRLGGARLDYLLRNAWSTLSDQRGGVRWFLTLSRPDQGAVLQTFLLHGRGAWGAFLFRYLRAETRKEVELREAAFERWSRASQGSDGTIGVAALDWLPRDLREREARRHLTSCPALASKPEQRIRYAGLLPFAEAKEVLAPFLGHPEGEQRAVAQSILIGTVRHDHGAIEDAVKNVKARKAEQDPVRKAMFDALASLRAALFRAEHLEAIGGIIQDALDAADLSHATSGAVERLVVQLFRIDGAWGARWLSRLFAIRGQVSTFGLAQGLTPADAKRLAPAIADLASGWATRERAGAIISLAASLGVRLADVAPLLDALEKLTRDLPFVGVSSAALALLEKHDRPRFHRLVPELLGADESYVLVASVARHVSLRRQDLLRGRLLASEPMSGRFATGQTSWVVDFQIGHGRWTEQQHLAYAAGLVSILQDQARDVPTLRFAIATLVRLAFADASAILPFASDPRPPLREMAIRGLPWLDARQGVPVLIEALGDDRARWAIYALRKVFSELRREDVLAELRAVPTSKVTVAKEVVRLLGELGGDDAYQELLRLDTPKTHRDVRIALLRALWDHLDKEETWAIFGRAVQDPDWVVAGKLADIPLGRLSAAAEERVVTLLSTLLRRKEPEARLDLLRRVAYLPLADAQRSLFNSLLSHLGVDAPEEAALAFHAILQRMTSQEVNAVSFRFKGQMGRPRHLLALLPFLSSRLGPYSPSHVVSVASDVLQALRAESRTLPHYIQLGQRIWGWKELSEAFADLSKRDAFYHEVMDAALTAARACVHPDLLEEKLAKHPDPRLRRLGLAALLSATAPEHGWTEARRARLLAYQKDPSASVAGPASFVFPP